MNAKLKWTDGCDALVDFVEEHGGSMGGETRDHLFNIVQHILDGQMPIPCDFDIDHYCRTHTSWLCIWPPVTTLELDEVQEGCRPRHHVCEPDYQDGRYVYVCGVPA